MALNITADRITSDECADFAEYDFDAGHWWCNAAPSRWLDRNQAISMMTLLELDVRNEWGPLRDSLLAELKVQPGEPTVPTDHPRRSYGTTEIVTYQWKELSTAITVTRPQKEGLRCLLCGKLVRSILDNVFNTRPWEDAWPVGVVGPEQTMVYVHRACETGWATKMGLDLVAAPELLRPCPACAGEGCPTCGGDGVIYP